MFVSAHFFCATDEFFDYLHVLLIVCHYLVGEGILKCGFSFFSDYRLHRLQLMLSVAAIHSYNSPHSYEQFTFNQTCVSYAYYSSSNFHFQMSFRRYVNHTVLVHRKTHHKHFFIAVVSPLTEPVTVSLLDLLKRSEYCAFCVCVIHVVLYYS